MVNKSPGVQQIWNRDEIVWKSRVHVYDSSLDIHPSLLPTERNLEVTLPLRQGDGGRGWHTTHSRLLNKLWVILGWLFESVCQVIGSGWLKLVGLLFEWVCQVIGSGWLKLVGFLQTFFDQNFQFFLPESLIPQLPLKFSPFFLLLPLSLGFLPYHRHPSHSSDHYRKLLFFVPWSQKSLNESRIIDIYLMDKLLLASPVNLPYITIH